MSTVQHECDKDLTLSLSEITSRDMDSISTGMLHKEIEARRDSAHERFNEVHKKLGTSEERMGFINVLWASCVVITFLVMFGWGLLDLGGVVILPINAAISLFGFFVVCILCAPFLHKQNSAIRKEFIRCYPKEASELGYKQKI